MRLKLKIEVEPYWIIGVRGIHGSSKFDFENKRDVANQFIDEIKCNFVSVLDYNTLKLEAHYLLAFALDENLNGFTITNVVASSEWTGDFLKIDYIINFEYRGLFNPFKTVNEDDLRSCIVKWMGDERLYIMDNRAIVTDFEHGYWLDVDTSPSRVRIEHELKLG
jgi:hypothetical protein